MTDDDDHLGFISMDHFHNEMCLVKTFLTQFLPGIVPSSLYSKFISDALFCSILEQRKGTKK